MPPDRGTDDDQEGRMAERGRVRRALPVLAACVLLSACTLSNSATARSTPSPASDEPYPATTAPTPTETPAATPTPTPKATASPDDGGKTRDVAVLVLSVARTENGYTIAFQRAQQCTKRAASGPCKDRPAGDDTLDDGSWLAPITTTVDVRALLPDVTGSLEVDGDDVSISEKGLNPLAAPKGRVIDARKDPIAAALTLNDDGVRKVTGL